MLAIVEVIVSAGCSFRSFSDEERGFPFVGFL